MVVTLASTGGAAKIYCVNGGGATGKNAAAWLEQKVEEKGKRRKKGGQGGLGGEGEIRLIQDFDFPEASNKLKTTRDGKHLVATGTYKPRMKVFDLEELSLKTERVTDSENVDFCILSSDWTKTLHLQTDRSLELHNQSASHYRVRMPKHGRTLAYHFPSCDAIVGGQGSEVWRMNMEVGRFMKPFALEGSLEGDGGESGQGVGGGLTGDKVLGVNAIDINPAHQLMCFGTETVQGRGTVELWDPRSRTRAGILRLPYTSLMGASQSSASLLQPKLPGVDDVLGGGATGLSVTALANKSDGLNLAVGTSSGHILLYDLRANRPYQTKDQGYGLPVKKVEWIESATSSAGDADREGGYVASADEKVVKIWGRETGNNLVAINPPMQINDLHVYPGTGLVFLANETSPMTGYYVPQLGPAPKWCRFLDNMTEEMEEDQETLLYDDYKFVDQQELEDLNLTHLIGSDTLKPYMHGYFIDLRLYTKAKAIANPFAYAEHRDKLIRDKLAAEQESRIRGAKKASSSKAGLESGIKVNKSLAKKLRQVEERQQKKEAGIVDDEDGEDEDKRRKRKRKSDKLGDQPSLLKDDRFGAIFENPDFEIDEESREFQLLNPSTKPNRNRDNEDDSDVSRDDEEASESERSDHDDDDSDSDSSIDLGFDKTTRRPIEPAPSTSRIRSSTTSSVRPSASRTAAPARPKPSLVVADGSDDEAITAARARPLASHEQRATQSFAQRARESAGAPTAGTKRRKAAAAETTTTDGDDIIRGGPGGVMEMSFVPKGKSDDDVAQKKKEVKAKRDQEKKEKAKFGMGLEKSDGQGSVEDEREIEGEEGSGRTRMRKPLRSASRNKTRHL
ncbi:hypothetical protein JCM16303_007152 [Sporobolomyces ruberrimus]